MDDDMINALARKYAVLVCNILRCCPMQCGAAFAVYRMSNKNKGK